MKLSREQDTMAQKQGLLGSFAYLDDLLEALKAVREQGLTIDAVYSPLPRHEIREAMRLKTSPVRYFTLTGGILGVCTGVFLVVYTVLQWRFIVSGKPIVPFVPTVIVAFEFCILLGVLFNLTGMLINLRLPKFRLPAHYDVRFNQDRFGVLVLCSESEREGVSSLLMEAGAEEVQEVEE